MKKIYVGNLPFSATEDEVRKLFEEHGTVESVNVIMDKQTGRARGFGFVEMAPAEADAAIQAVNGASMSDRALNVNEARPRRSEGGSDRGSW